MSGLVPPGSGSRGIASTIYHWATNTSSKALARNILDQCIRIERGSLSSADKLAAMKDIVHDAITNKLRNSVSTGAHTKTPESVGNTLKQELQAIYEEQQLKSLSVELTDLKNLTATIGRAIDSTLAADAHVDDSFSDSASDTSELSIASRAESDPKPLRSALKQPNQGEKKQLFFRQDTNDSSAVHEDVRTITMPDFRYDYQVYAFIERQSSHLPTVQDYCEHKREDLTKKGAMYEQDLSYLESQMSAEDESSLLAAARNQIDVDVNKYQQELRKLERLLNNAPSNRRMLDRAIFLKQSLIPGLQTLLRELK